MEVTLNPTHGQAGPEHIQKVRFNTLSGITLIELLVVMAIIAITLGAGLPGVSAMLQTNRMAATLNALSGSFALARSEAVTRKQEVVICKSRNGEFCTNKGGWEQGWIIFEDRNGNERRDKGEVRFRIQETLPPGIEIRFSAFHSDHYVIYWATGFTEMNGTFIFCQQNRPELTKALILSKIGRLRKSNTRVDGSPLVCQ